jgi:uncharacterized DUF497 family protein
MFEFDPNKSASNKTKHRIDFEQAMQLWNESDRVIIEAITEDEQRFFTYCNIR